MTEEQILSTLHQQIHTLRSQLNEKSYELDRALERISDLEARHQNTSEDQYHQMFEASISSKLLIDPDTGSIVDANPAACRFYGYDKAALLGMKITDLSISSAEVVYQNIHKAYSEQQWVFPVRHRLANGDIRDVEAIVTPISVNGRTLLYSNVYDVTERKLEETELRLLWHAVNQSANSIVITDVTGRIEYVNPYFTQLTGYTLEEAIGQNPRILKSGHTASDEYKKLWETITSGREWVGEFYNKKKNGEFYWERARIAPVTNAEGEITHFVAIKEDITERKQAEDALHESEKRFRNTFEQAAVGLSHVTPEGHFLLINQKLCDLVGYTREEMLSKTFQEITYPDDLETDLKQAQRMAAHEIETYTLEKRYIRKDQTIQWVELTVSMVSNADGTPDYYIAVVQDITQRVQTQQKLATANVRLEEQVSERTKQLLRLNDRMSTVLNNVSNPLLLVSAGGTIDVTNPALNRVLGYQMDELFDQSLWRIFETPYRPALMDLFRTLDEHTPLGPIQTRLITKSGTAFDAEVSFTQVPGNSGHVVCTLYNISHLKEMERIKDEFISMVSHELRTPITSIMLSASTLQRHFDQMTEDNKLQKVARITEQAQALADFVTSILDVSRFDTRQGKRGQETVNVSQALEDVVSELAEQAESRHQHIQVEVVSGGFTVMGEYSDLVRVWRNLLHNAVKYTPDGGSIRAALYGAGSTDKYRAADLNGFRDSVPADIFSGRYLIGMVEDTGHGIQLEDLPHLFTRFFRGWAAGTNITGSGLGLSLVRDLVRLYGGDIAVSSVLNIGTTFCFWLPVNEGNNP